MRIGPATLLAALAVSAVAAVATAQTYSLPVPTFEASVTPAKAGTRRAPKPSKLRLRLAVQPEARVTADQIVFDLPRHVRVSGKGFRYCPASKLESTRKPAGCPKRSRVGRGTATAALGDRLRPIDFDVQVFAGGRSELGIWFRATNLGVAEALRGVVSRAGWPHHQRITIDVPRALQRQLGSWIYLTGFEATLGAANGRKGRRRTHLVTTVGCPADVRHRFEARLRLAANPDPPPPGEAARADASSCR